MNDVKFGIISATAQYTGGNIYIYYGKLSDGRFFRACDDWGVIWITDADTSSQDADYGEFYDAHLVETITDADYGVFWNTMLLHILMNDSEGNYDPDELKCRMETGNHKASGFKIYSIHIENNEVYCDIATFGSGSMIVEDLQLCENLLVGIEYKKIEVLRKIYGPELVHNFINDMLIFR